MRIMTLLGTRPEIIRLSRIIPRLDHSADHFLLHTGQNFAANLSDVFFRELTLREPNAVLDSRSDSVAGQIGKILQGVERELGRFRPDRVLLLGDTNSALATLVIERMGVPVFHMEAGNRCRDWKVPEEVNRRVIDAIASFALPYTPGSRDNLVSEGIRPERIFVCGNPIKEVLDHYARRIAASDVHSRLGLAPREYLLATAHRSENVDDPTRLRLTVAALEAASRDLSLPLVLSVHPRTRQKLDALELIPDPGRIRCVDAMGFFDFVKLEQNARLVLTDSGTVQEECCIFRVPAVTIRDSTERPETLACGSNIVSGLETDRVVAAVRAMAEASTAWRMPEGYDDDLVSEKVVRFMLGEPLPRSAAR
ncbi:MAG: UDP-N-acetylglucosamine 2-epimerase (non-hydrolyzing) [Alphaproteobacteria bacterium]|nr:UDP-N-acetylglucosamine 2-epimerase (non-hydrolyzing) [Alphaproteobacteria bacterium]